MGYYKLISNASPRRSSSPSEVTRTAIDSLQGSFRQLVRDWRDTNVGREEFFQRERRFIDLYRAELDKGSIQFSLAIFLVPFYRDACVSSDAGLKQYFCGLVQVHSDVYNKKFFDLLENVDLHLKPSPPPPSPSTPTQTPRTPTQPSLASMRRDSSPFPLREEFRPLVAMPGMPLDRDSPVDFGVYETLRGQMAELIKTGQVDRIARPKKSDSVFFSELMRRLSSPAPGSETGVSSPEPPRRSQLFSILEEYLNPDTTRGRKEDLKALLEKRTIYKGKILEAVAQDFAEVMRSEYDTLKPHLMDVCVRSLNRAPFQCFLLDPKGDAEVKRKVVLEASRYFSTHPFLVAEFQQMLKDTRYSLDLRNAIAESLCLFIIEPSGDGLRPDFSIDLFTVVMGWDIFGGRKDLARQLQLLRRYIQDPKSDLVRQIMQLDHSSVKSPNSYLFDWFSELRGTPYARGKYQSIHNLYLMLRLGLADCRYQRCASLAEDGRDPVGENLLGSALFDVSFPLFLARYRHLLSGTEQQLIQRWLPYKDDFIVEIDKPLLDRLTSSWASLSEVERQQKVNEFLDQGLLMGMVQRQWNAQQGLYFLGECCDLLGDGNMGDNIKYGLISMIWASIYQRVRQFASSETDRICSETVVSRPAWFQFDPSGDPIPHVPFDAGMWLYHTNGRPCKGVEDFLGPEVVRV